MSTNPLSNYLRKPEIYVKLPSGGRWWPEGSIEIPPNGELPVSAMNGHDDLTMRNADGLMNGASSVEVIQSCVPSILNAWVGPNMDIEYLFIAIRIASYGEEMAMEKKCGKCGETTKFGINLQIMLEQMSFPDFSVPMQIDDLKIMLKPATFQMTNLTAQEIFEQQRSIAAARSRDLTMDQKEEILRRSLKKLGEITVSKLVEYIDFVLLPSGERVDQVEYIQEFINECDRKTFDQLKAGVESMNNQYSTPKIPFECHSCKSKETTSFEFNPSNFFAAGS